MTFAQAVQSWDDFYLTAGDPRGPAGDRRRQDGRGGLLALLRRLLAHRLVDNVAVMPLGLAFEVLEHPLVVPVHLRAVRVLAVNVFALEDDAEPQLVGVLGGTEHRVVDPAFWRVGLEPGHLLHERVGMSWLQSISGNRSEHHTFTSTREKRTA